jgi:hypothetical protein
MKTPSSVYKTRKTQSARCGAAFLGIFLMTAAPNLDLPIYGKFIEKMLRLFEAEMRILPAHRISYIDGQLNVSY